MWWIGGIIGLTLSLGNNDANTFFYIIGGVLAGMLIRFSFESLTNSMQQSNMTLHEQSAALMHELKRTLASLEARMQLLEQELRTYRQAGTNNQPQSTPSEYAEKAITPVSLDELSKSAASGTQLQDIEKPQSTAEASKGELENKLTLPIKLEAALKTSSNHAVTSVSTTNQAPLKTITTPSISAPIPVKPQRLPPPPEKTIRERLPAPIANFIFGGNALVKIGGLILFLGLAFLLRYASERVTVPIELRYASVAATGAALLLLGWILRNKRRDYALILQGMAIGVFYLTSLSAVKVHALISPEMGFGFLFMVSILSAALAMLQKAPALAIAAALAGFVSPVLTSTGANRPMGLFTYLAILDMGIFLVAWFNAWRVLNVIAFVGTFSLSIGWAQKFYVDSDYALVQPFLIFFFVLFAAIGVLFARRTLLEARHEASRSENSAPSLTQLKVVGRVDSALVFGNPVTAFGLQYMLVKHTDFGAAFSALAIAFFYIVLARIIFSKEKQGLALLAEAYLIVAAIFATLAIPLGLEGTWTSAAWAVEGAGMYWLGVRQNRPYARAFSFVVILGATVKLLYATSINVAPNMPLLEGALLGPILLGLSALAMWRLHCTKTDIQFPKWEASASSGLAWLGIAALACVPWMLLVPSYAAATTAILGLLVSDLSLRFGIRIMRTIAAAMQTLSLLSFATTLHINGIDNGIESSGAFLSDGWRGMAVAVVIALSILLNAGRHMLNEKRQREAQALPPNWSKFNSMALISAFALLHVAMLFAIDLSQAACIWPITAWIVLWGALVMSQGALASFALSLQVFSAGIFFVHSPTDQGTAFTHLGFITPLILALTAWCSGDRIRAESVRFYKSLKALENNPNAISRTSGQAWLNPWCTTSLVLWLPPIWGLAWWIFAWSSETTNVLSAAHQTKILSAASVAISVGTTAFLLFLARWRQWQQMGALSSVGLFILIYSAALGFTNSQGTYFPSDAWGAVAWPVALLWQGFVLHQQERYLDKQSRLLAWLHILSFWLFLMLASSEVRSRFVSISDPDSSWILLGWIVVPASALWVMTQKWLETRWPLNRHRHTYLEAAITPVAIYLFAWCWLSNVVCAGGASPLPYFPLLNPLELAQCLIMVALVLWQRALPVSATVRLSNLRLAAVVAVTGLALLTGMVLRCVHQFGDIAWSFNSMFDSGLAQATVSITWALCGVSAMLLGNRRDSRATWIVGAFLLAIVVLKLFVIELADRGDLYRVISCMGVGLAFLIVGYFAPVPVKRVENLGSNP